MRPGSDHTRGMDHHLPEIITRNQMRRIRIARIKTPHLIIYYCCLSRMPI